MSFIKKEHQIILEHLKEYGRLSTYDSKRMYGIPRLLKYINELRLLGYSITNDWEMREDESGNTDLYEVYVIKSLKKY